MTTDKDQKDRFGDKLRDLERAREDKYFAERDRELIEKLRADKAQAVLCPVCLTNMSKQHEEKVSLHSCGSGHGVWLSAEELALAAEPANAPLFSRLVARLTGR
jgi:hypothetical protein